MQPRSLRIVLVVLLCVCPLAAQQNLTARIDALLDDSRFASARWGIHIVRADGSSLYERDADRLFVPASNQKLFITAAVLDRFGADHRFKTSVYGTRNLDTQGTLQGDLILYGRGDPNLSARLEADPGNFDQFVASDRIAGIEALADQLYSRGLRRVTGDLVADDSYFSVSSAGLGPDWGWDGMQFYYEAPISALTVNDNVVTFVVTPAAAGAPPAIAIKPLTSVLTVVNRARTARSGSGGVRIGIDRPPGSSIVEFFGTIPAGSAAQSFQISVPDPASFAGSLLMDALARRGIQLAGKMRRVSAIDRVEEPWQENRYTEMAGVESLPLSTLLKVINRPSQNLHAEIMLRQLGSPDSPAEIDEYGRPVLSETRGVKALEMFLTQAGLDTSVLNLADGSGLSRQNLITPRSVTTMMRFMSSHPLSAVYVDSLPGAGEGTLRNRLRGTAAEGNIRAKTGSLTAAASMAGYLTTTGGETLTFSFISNNYTGPSGDVTRVFDLLCRLLAELTL